MKVASVVGARPQFIKAAMVSAALADAGIQEVLIHTGQHYDFAMSALFFEQLNIAEPQYNLGIGSGTHGAQTARILEAIEKVLLTENTDGSPVDAIIVYGDTNSTLAGALAAVKIHVPVAHVEAGLRSYNRRMPEEINRVLTDHASDLLFVPTAAAVENLRREGIEGNKVHVVGDVMYDAALAFKPLYLPQRDELLQQAGLEVGNYFVATIHRAENTDDPQILKGIVQALNQVASEIAPVLWPVHPRTRGKLREMEIAPSPQLHLVEPVGYLQIQAYLTGARGALADSGGLQKEAAFHGIPTLTLRNETEWPETVESGCNQLVGTHPERIVATAAQCNGATKPCTGFGEGNSAQLIAQILKDWAS